MDKLVTTVLSGQSDTDGHMLTLFSLVLSLKARRVLELGVRDGNTTRPLLKAAALTGGTLTSVDVRRTSGASSLEGSPGWRYVISDSLAFLRGLSPMERFDLVFVDDWHDGLHVAEELRLLERHVTRSSLVLLHDTMCWHTVPEYNLHKGGSGEFGNGGPFAAVLGLDKSKWEYSTIPACHGLTILRRLVEPARPPPVARTMDYSLVLTTHKRPAEAARVLRELAATALGKGPSVELLVIGHSDEDRPVGPDLPPFRFETQPVPGCCSSIWHGTRICLGRWFAWLCDDHVYPQRDWFERAHALRLSMPAVKVVQFNAKTRHTGCAQVGMAECAWYVERYPEPVFQHYGWDQEILSWAVEEGVFHSAKDVVIEDPTCGSQINWGLMSSDHNKLDARRRTHKWINGKRGVSL